jgi:hypothetical protein
MPGTKEKTEISEHDVDGHSVRIVRGLDREELWIDGTRRRFFKYPGGYVLADNAFVPPQETLLEAARDYLKQAEREKPSRKRGQR